MTIDKRALRRGLRTNFTPGVRDRLGRAKLRLRQASHLPYLVAGRKLDRPVFIIGAPRSGTSLLYAILRTSSHLAHWPGEAHEIWEADYHPALRGWRSNVLRAEDVDPDAAAAIRRNFLLVTGARKRLTDKTPRNVLRIPFVDALFPDARLVYLQRDGRDNVNSLINAWRTPRYRTYEIPTPHSIPGCDPKWWKFVLYPGWEKNRRGPLELVCAKQWTSCNDFAINDGSSLPGDRWATVRYEELVQNPVDEVGRLVEFLDLPYEDVTRRRAAATSTTLINTVTPPERGKWKRENPAEVEAIEDLIAPTMKAMGYE